MDKKNFYSKILLFGEYSIIKGSDALALPFSLFEGHLAFADQTSNADKVQESTNELKAFYSYIEALEKEDGIGFDLTSFKFDLEQKLFFHSTIPQGFGVGSSGALCAAIYDRYVEKRPQGLKDLQKRFAKIESHFHGSSSGIDPLISYLNSPVLMRGDGSLENITLPPYDSGKGAIFLLNTKRRRRTEPLVNLFLEKCKNEDFEKFCQENLFKATNDCILHFMEGQVEELYQSFTKLSEYQLEHFNPMIPKLTLPIWEEGLKSGDFSLKLCGAGGGGFLLGMTKDFEALKSKLNDLEIRSVLKF